MNENYFFNVNIEKSILNTLLFSIERKDIANILSKVNAEHFYLPAHTDIYYVILKLYDEQKPITEEFIHIELMKQEKFNEHALLDVCTATPISNPTEYIEVLNELKKLRKLDAITNQVKMMFTKMCSSDEIQSYFDSELMSLDKERSSSMPMSMREVIEEYNGVPQTPKIEMGVGTGKFDSMLMGGIESSQLVHIGGDSNVGKTTLTKQILRNVSINYKSLFFSFEMPRRKIMENLVKHGGQWNADNFFIADQQMMGSDVSDVAWMIRRWHQMHNIRFVVIDSKMKLTHKHFKGSNSAERIGDIDATLSRLCQELDIVVFMITQLSKEDQRNGTMSGYGSGMSDYEADMKILLSFVDGEKDLRRKVEIKKNRQDVKFDPVVLTLDVKSMEFGDIEIVQEQIYGGDPMPFGGSQVNQTYQPINAPEVTITNDGVELPSGPDGKGFL